MGFSRPCRSGSYPRNDAVEQMVLLARMQKNEWAIPPADARVGALSQALGISPLVAQALINRGIVDIEAGRQFLQPKLVDLIRPARMPGIDAAVRRLTKALEKKEKITVYGDYDVDGITGVSILWELLTLLGALRLSGGKRGIARCVLIVDRDLQWAYKHERPRGTAR